MHSARIDLILLRQNAKREVLRPEREPLLLTPFRTCYHYGRPAGAFAVSDDFILQTENLTKEFAGFIAVNSVNLQVARGTIHALIGPNGAGKTTCFNLLTKFMSP